MKKLAFAIFLVFAVNAFGDLDALRNAEMVYKSAQRAEQARIKAEQDRRDRQARARAAEQEKARQARIAAQKAEEKAEKERAYNDYMNDKKRDQNFEDELRRLELEERRAELEERKAMRQARSKRADEFVSEELNRQKAQTDVIQSEADVDRSLTEGAKDLMSKEGDARIKANSGFFK